jgi:hypothetical protein
MAGENGVLVDDTSALVVLPAQDVAVSKREMHGQLEIANFAVFPRMRSWSLNFEVGYEEAEESSCTVCFRARGGFISISMPLDVARELADSIREVAGFDC